MSKLLQFQPVAGWPWLLASFHRLTWGGLGVGLFLSLVRWAFWLIYSTPTRRWEGHTVGILLTAGLTADALVVGFFTLGFLSVAALLCRWGTPGKLNALVCIQSVSLGLLALLAISEIYYYGFYHSRFDPIVFGLGEDNTSALLLTIWKDYPVLRVLGGITLGVWVWHTLGQRIFEQSVPSSLDKLPQQRRLLWGIIGMLAALLCMNQVGVWARAQEKTIPHPGRFILALDRNAVTSLWDAIAERSEYISVSDDPLAGIHRWGFQSLDQTARAAQWPLSSTGMPAHLFQTTPGVNTGKRPNIVLALLEAFGMDPLNYDGPRNDLLGRLRPHLTSDYLFTNIMTGQPGTHPELENIFLGSPITPLTLSHDGAIPYVNAAMRPFQRAGYRTVLVFAGHRGWRQVGSMMAMQGFDEVYDQDDILKAYPDATATPWGAYDAYVFRFAKHVLDTAQTTGKPVFVFLITNTNHPPYTLDTPHPSLPVDPAALGQRGNADPVLREKILRTYQYQADQFGAFLDAVEHEDVADNTIIAGFGDHNLHDLFQYQLPQETPQVDRVALLFHLPTRLKPALVHLDRWGGHKDIMPTLVSLAIPGERYFNTGVNLFGPPTSEDYGLSLYSRLYTDEGVVFDLVHPLFYRWKEGHQTLEGESSPLPEALQQRSRQIAAQVALRDWFIRQQVIAHRADQK